jgi:glycosyltransferase involved in cell wall biosynthesis
MNVGSERLALPEVSIVIPVLDEAENLRQLHHELTEALSSLECPYEIVFVDDGSTDGSTAILVELSRADPAVQVIEFRRNFGKTAALIAGFRHSRGQVIITMDADLQDNPAELPRLIGMLEEGYDLVVSWRVPRQDPISKTAPSHLFNWLVAAMTGLRLHDFNTGFKAYRRPVTEEVKLYGELHRFIPVLAYRKGFRVAEVPVSHRPRSAGRSKYGIGRLGRGLFDFLTVLFLTTYLYRPLHLFGTVGLLIFLAGTAINIYMVIIWYFGEAIGRRPLLLLGVLSMLLGLQFISTGLLGEMVRHFTFQPEAEYSIRNIWTGGEATTDAV